MYKYLPVSAASKLSLALFVAMSSTLAACSNGELALDDTYVPATHYERFPIEVTSGPVKMEISSRHGTLQSAQINAISGFSRSARNSGSSRITILRPSGWRRIRQGRKANLSVARAKRHFARHDFAKNLSGRVQGAGAAVLYPQRCGHQGMRRLVVGSGEYVKQRALSEFWLCHQNNIAAMVVNPDDFVAPAPTRRLCRHADAWSYGRHDRCMQLQFQLQRTP